jgi:hypothetical protein
MESMDEMFVPYKNTLELPTQLAPNLPLESTPSSSFSTYSMMWIGIAVVFLIFILASSYFLASPSSAQKKSLGKEEYLSSETVKTQKILSAETTLPATIDFLEPAKINTETMSKEELAKFVGTEIKNLLVLYSGVSSLQTASIVSHSVRTMLEDFAPILQPQAVASTLPHKQSSEKLDEEYISKVLQPRPQTSLVDLDAEDEEEKDPPKKGKINADTDPSLLLMLKQRGLVQ